MSGCWRPSQCSTDCQSGLDHALFDGFRDSFGDLGGAYGGDGRSRQIKHRSSHAAKTAFKAADVYNTVGFTVLIPGHHRGEDCGVRLIHKQLAYFGFGPLRQQNPPHGRSGCGKTATHMNQRRQPVRRGKPDQVKNVAAVQNTKVAGPVVPVTQRLQGRLRDLQQFAAGQIAVA